MGKTCEYCGKVFKNQGGLNLHKAIHCKSKPAAAVKEEVKETKKEEVCSHEWEMMIGANELEQRAMAAGFDSVCKKCGGVE